MKRRRECAWISTSEWEFSRRRPGADQRLPERGRENVIEIEMQLSDHTHPAAALIVDGKDGFDADLEITSDPDHAWSDESGRHEAVAKIVGDRGHQADFDDWDQVIEEVR